MFKDVKGVYYTHDGKMYIVDDEISSEDLVKIWEEDFRSKRAEQFKEEAAKKFIFKWNGSLDRMIEKTRVPDKGWFGEMLLGYRIPDTKELYKDPKVSMLKVEVFDEFYKFVEDRCNLFTRSEMLMRKQRELENLWDAIHHTEEHYEKQRWKDIYRNDNNEKVIRRNLDALKI